MLNAIAAILTGFAAVRALKRRGRNDWSDESANRNPTELDSIPDFIRRSSRPGNIGPIDLPDDDTS